METPKHPLLEIPLLKLLSLVILFSHIIGIPFIYIYGIDPVLFERMEFIKLIVLTTAGGVILTGAFSIMILSSLVFRYKTNIFNIGIYSSVLILLNAFYLINDVIIITLYTVFHTEITFIKILVGICTTTLIILIIPSILRFSTLNFKHSGLPESK